MDKRNGLLPWLTHSQDTKTTSCSPRKPSWSIASTYTYLLNSKVLMGIAMSAMVAVFGLGALGCSRSQVEFDLRLLLPRNSYLTR